MKKIIILIPVLNDWESLNKLIFEINENIKDLKNISVKCLVVNDASTIARPNISRPKNIEVIKILNMRENRGHARCNAFGIRHIIQKEKFDFLILMDGDGEDRPVELKYLIQTVILNQKKSVVAKRIKRSEGPFFRFLYLMHKIITLIFTGKLINFGNYSCLIKKDVEALCNEPSLWSSFSGSVKKNIKELNEIESIRGSRYFGPSKMSFLKLLTHSFSIIAVFKYQVILRSILIIIILSIFQKYFGFIIILIQSMIVLFNIIIFAISFREKKDELLNSHKNLINVEEL